MHRKRGQEEALGFGWGEHRCVAESLARAELEIVFGRGFQSPSGHISITQTYADNRIGTLFQRLPNLKLAIPFEEIEFTPPTRDVGIVELPVVW